MKGRKSDGSYHEFYKAEVKNNDGYRNEHRSCRKAGKLRVSQAHQFGLINNMWGLILIYSANAPMGYLTQKGFFDTIPSPQTESGTWYRLSESSGRCPRDSSSPQ